MRFTSPHGKEGALVLIDEAAAGTDPEEGGALYQSFIESMLNKEAFLVVTLLHHGSLKVFAHEHEKAVNGSMEFDQVNLAPTYQFKKGIPGVHTPLDIAPENAPTFSHAYQSPRGLGYSKKYLRITNK